METEAVKKFKYRNDRASGALRLGKTLRSPPSEPGHKSCVQLPPEGKRRFHLPRKPLPSLNSSNFINCFFSFA